jgi:type II secretory pathway pseudopilin PulG
MKIIANQNGFTYILALTIVMIMGIMLGMVGQSWKTIKQREQEKELLFRGSQIKEAIENWYNPTYIPGGGTGSKSIKPLLDLKDLLEGGQQANKKPYLPHTYAAELDDKNPKCSTDCPKLKVYQDPMTGKNWNIIKCDISSTTNAFCMKFPGTNTIIGVASSSDETPFRTDFKDTALENMGSIGVVTAPVIPGSVPQAAPYMGFGMSKYSEWKFIADPQNDHTKIYRAYHEGW